MNEQNQSFSIALGNYIEKRGVKFIVNDYGEKVYSTPHKVVFSNGWCASIVKRDKVYTVAPVDYNGRFDWGKLNNYGSKFGVVSCKNINDVISVCEVIRRFRA